MLLLSFITTLVLIPTTALDLDTPTTTEENGIAWSKAFSCDEAAQSIVYDNPFNDLNGFIEYAKYATSIKFVSSSYSTYATSCSNPVYNLNNGKELSYKTDENTGKLIGYADKSNWNGNDNLMWNSCYGAHPSGSLYPFDLNKSMYWACNNNAGLLVIPNTNTGYYNDKIACHWNGEKIMDVYLGFDKDLTNDCEGNPLPFQSPDSRDCSVLAIDEFLLQCSTQFPSQVTAVNDLDSRLTQLETNLQFQIDENTNDITQLQNDLNTADSGVTTQMQQLQTDIDATNARIDLFAAKAPHNMMIDNNGGNNTIGNVLGLSLKDLFIVAFLCANLITMIYIYCYKQNGAQKQVYLDIEQ